MSKYDQEFLNTLIPVYACPFCGDIKLHGHAGATPEVLTCCGKMEVTETYLDPTNDNDLLLYDADMWTAFQNWQEAEDSKEELAKLDGDKPDEDWRGDR